MEKNKDSPVGFTEIESTEYILNLDFYLHKAILEAIGAIGTGIKKDAPREGFLNLTISVDIAVGVATAKGIFDPSDEEFKAKLSNFKTNEVTNATDLTGKAQIAKFTLIEILRKINEHGVKHGKLII